MVTYVGLERGRRVWLKTEAGGLLTGSPVVESSRTGVSTEDGAWKGGARVSALPDAPPVFTCLHRARTAVSVRAFLLEISTRAPGGGRGREGQCGWLICFQWEQIMS